MDPNWNDSQPIYRQLRDRVVTMILEGVLKDGDALPSVRQVASEYQLNPVDEDLVEKKRGLGMFVREGAQTALMRDERSHFLEEEWPMIVARIERLGLRVRDLLGNTNGEER